MSLGVFERLKDYWNRQELEQARVYDEYKQLEEELRGLLNEVRFQEEPAFEADRARKAELLEQSTRYLIYETREPQRSQLQGRCQVLVEEVERPEAVRARIGEVQTRLREMREQSLVLDDADTVAQDAAA